MLRWQSSSFHIFTSHLGDVVVRSICRANYDKFRLFTLRFPDLSDVSCLSAALRTVLGSATPPPDAEAVQQTMKNFLLLCAHHGQADHAALVWEDPGWFRHAAHLARTDAMKTELLSLLYFAGKHRQVVDLATDDRGGPRSSFLLRSLTVATASVCHLGSRSDFDAVRGMADELLPRALREGHERINPLTAHLAGKFGETDLALTLLHRPAGSTRPSYLQTNVKLVALLRAGRQADAVRALLDKVNELSDKPLTLPTDVVLLMDEALSGTRHAHVLAQLREQGRVRELEAALEDLLLQPISRKEDQSDLAKLRRLKLFSKGEHREQAIRR